MSILAIDIGGTKLAMAVFEQSRLVEVRVHSTDRTGGRQWMLERILQQAGEWRHHHLTCCGVGFGGQVAFDTQRIVQSMHVDGWEDFPLSAYLHEKLGLPTIVDNDANVGALGEATYGAGKGITPLLYVTLSTGIGGGIVLKDGIYRGANCNAGEIGHLSIRPEGPDCPCGTRGCLERYCGGLSLEKDYGKPASELLRDPQFVLKYVVDLAAGLKSAIMLLNPARIVIGGGISRAGDALFIPLRAELRRQIPAWQPCVIDVVPAALGDETVLYGAAALAAGWKR